MRRNLAGAMLATGNFLAGVAVAVVLLEFDQLNAVGRSVAIVALASLAGMMVWAYTRSKRRSDEPGKAMNARVDDRSSPRSSEDGLPDELPMSREGSGSYGGVAEPRILVDRDVHSSGGRERPTNDDGALEYQADGWGSQDGNAQEDLIETDATEEDTAPTPPPSAEIHRKSDHEPDDIDLSALRDLVVNTWDHYLRYGDGHFNAEGFREQLANAGIEASVSEGDTIEATGNVLLVQHAKGRTDCFFVVPNFTKSPRAAPDWFEDMSDGTLTRRTQTIHRLAEGKWTDTGFAVVEKGSIE